MLDSIETRAFTDIFIHAPLQRGDLGMSGYRNRLKAELSTVKRLLKNSFYLSLSL